MHRLTDLPNEFLDNGQYCFSFEEAVNWSQRSVAAVQAGLARLAIKQQVFSPARGFYVIVPANLKSSGVVPEEWFIDPMMKHLDRQYYVALLSAAAFHGASHQIPQVFQAMVDRHLPNRVIGGLRMQFIASNQIHNTATQRATSQIGFYRVSTREATIADCVGFPQHVGGIDNVATIATEIGPLDKRLLAESASRYPEAVRRRLGLILARTRPDIDLGPLARTLISDRVVPLEARVNAYPENTEIDPEWRVHLNIPLEVEI